MSRRIKKKKIANSTDKDVQKDEPVYNKNLYDHLKPENRAKEKAAQAAIGKKGSLTPVFAIVIIGVLVIAFALSGGFTGEFGGTTNSNNADPFINTDQGGYKPVSDICGDHDAGVQTHFHVILSIITFGNQRVVPEGIGDGAIQAGEVSDDCIRLIHTHVGDPAKIHIEIPVGYNGVFALGDFFNIWSLSIGTNILLSATSLLDQTGSVVILESNTEVIFIDNPANYQLQPLTDVNEFITLTLN